MRINLNEIIDPYDGRVIVNPDENGHIVAHFDLAGLPRVDSVLVGKNVHDAVSIAEHLCGICPAAHHLAGIRALDKLFSKKQDTRASQEDLSQQGHPDSHTLRFYAQLVRRLLHYGSHIDQHCVRLARYDSEAAVRLRHFARASMAVAGSPGHFPATAIPGGVRIVVDMEKVRGLLDQVSQALKDGERLCELASTFRSQASEHVVDSFDGANVALADACGNLDLLGDYVKAVNSRGEEILFEPVHQWPYIVKERIPGVSAPQPYLHVNGQNDISYRVGPVAQLSIGSVSTPRARTYQQQWFGSRRHALGARAIVLLMCVELIEHVCAQLLAFSDEERELVDMTIQASDKDHEPCMLQAGTATGLVDSPRGILEHTYTIRSDQTIESARILTPTAQNEPWLSQLLTQAIERNGLSHPHEALEESIREADPCLPISSAPEGTMGLRISVHENADKKSASSHGSHSKVQEEQ